MRIRLRISFVLLIISFLVFERCAYNDVNASIDCNASSLAIQLVSKSDVTDCRSINGTITVTATGGSEPYDFNINGGEYKTSGTFPNLGAGTYELRVKDANNCWRALSVSLSSAASSLAATVQTSADNQCSTDNGIAIVTASGGVAPYVYQIDSKGYGTDNKFEGLKEGQHVVVVKDAVDCQTTLAVRIEHGATGISYLNDIKPIITANCAFSGCHGAGAGDRDWTVFETFKKNAANIKTRTSNRTMPPDKPLSQDDINKIGCWVDDGALAN